MIEITHEFIKDLITQNTLEFSPTQGRISLPIINRLFKKMMIGVIFEDIKINENNIIDGHHRYLSSVIAEVNINKVGCPKPSLINCYNWNEVDFVYEEWDTKSKINYMNELDAKYSGIPLIIMTEITK
jgi:hypothetical protein